jgi:hypothetical protein
MDLKRVLGPILAMGLLLLIAVQTSQALRNTGVWGAHSPRPKAARSDPYARLESELARFDPGIPTAGLRDPFRYGSTPSPVRTTPTTPRVVVPPPPPKPVLTAIVMDEDPRALLQYLDRNYSVKTGDDFADFRVVSISRDEVVLDGHGQRLVLRRPSKGE